MKKFSPFAVFEEGFEQGFEELYEHLPADRKILFAIPEQLSPPKQWQLMVSIEGSQFLYEGDVISTPTSFHPSPLTTNMLMKWCNWLG